ncbi:alpha/beta hydrolase [Ferruginivarius sediminum]|uniref:Alpha/beta hydrolase n=1 Tax=Ferruginivarius sediminum TaxID=2661937 RepID=A0A369T798_9PROT|nr:alpha/beta hydrolase [Ferruginivarius sediminum]RDD60235.1 alpha/beta hydrolase [Ferruginivarius sediminum]
MVEVYFATNRNEREGFGNGFGNRFHHDGPHFYRVGWAEVEFTDLKKTRGGKDWDTLKSDWSAFHVDYWLYPETRPEPETVGPRELPEMHRKISENELPGSRRMFGDIQASVAQAKGDVLVYLHGFANSFTGSLARAAQLKLLYRKHPVAEAPDGPPKLGDEGREPVVFAFSWPSDGKVQPPWKYASDREDAAFSGVAMARALMRLVDFLKANEERCDFRINLVAHSMGNWALRHALLGFRALQDGRQLPRLFENVFLMAADEDEDALECSDKLGLLLEVGKFIHVYHHAGDDVLAISDTTKGNVDRLGSNGPRNMSLAPGRVVAVDCGLVGEIPISTLVDGDHQYYRLRPEVLDDVRHVLAGIKPDRIAMREVVQPGRSYRIKPAAAPRRRSGAPAPQRRGGR